MSLFNFTKNSNHQPKQKDTDNFGSKKIKNHYTKYLTISYLIAVFMLSAAFGTPLLLKKLEPANEQNSIKQQQKKEEKVVSYAQLSPPPEIEQEKPEEDKPEPKPEKEEPEPKQIPKKEPKKEPEPKEQEKLVEPEVKKDENVEEETSDLASQSEAREAAKSEPTASSSSESKATEQKVFDFAEQKPTYPGGRKALMSHIRTNIEYPMEARKAGAQGQVVVQFVVQTDGSIGNIKVLKDLGYGTAEEAKSLISSLPKKFEPGVQNGKKVPVRMTLPIDFNLEVEAN